MLSCVYRTYQLTTRKPIFKIESNSELTMKIIFSRLGHLQSGHALLSPLFQPRYSTVLNEKSNNLLPFFFRRAAVNHDRAASTKWEFLLYCCVTVLYKKKTRFFALNSIVLSFMYHALISA